MVYSKNKDKKFCPVKWCRNERGKGTHRVCAACRSYEYRNKNPYNCVWHWIKKSAEKRFIKFDLPKEWFFEFLKINNYTALSGRKGNQMTIDRIKPELGYIKDNLQVITRIENIKKYHNEEKYIF